MVSKFGGQLIEDLLDLKARTEILTSISGKLSVGSEYPPKDMLEE